MLRGLQVLHLLRRPGVAPVDIGQNKSVAGKCTKAKFKIAATFDANELLGLLPAGGVDPTAVCRDEGLK